MLVIRAAHLLVIIGNKTSTDRSRDRSRATHVTHHAVVPTSWINSKQSLDYLSPPPASSSSNKGGATGPAGSDITADPGCKQYVQQMSLIRLSPRYGQRHQDLTLRDTAGLACNQPTSVYLQTYCITAADTPHTHSCD